MAYIPSISNSAAALFIPYILVAYLTQIGYRFAPIDMASISSSRNTLSNIIEEYLVTSMLDLRREFIMSAKLCMSSDHGNKKGLHDLVEVISMLNTKDNCVKRITLDTDASGGTSDDTADGINVLL